ncbi:MAG: hydroxyethylthiazole kinase [Desulfovibrionaceae bacterium]|nr:hydroxyethylthiazole kinase [Desulfovibrionaceae bacterium]
MGYAEKIWASIEAIRTARPFVLSVTNNVVTNLTANVLLALGASPAMTHAAPDAAELAGLAGAVVLNMGTPQQAYVESMLAAGRAANAAGVPVIFDPVAAGASAYRAQVALELLAAVDMAVVRGNASEILFLAGGVSNARGVDARDEAAAAVDGARRLAEKLSCVVCVSGAVDYVTGGASVLAVAGGVAMMTRVTGLGCAATALTGAFAAVSGDMLEASAFAMAAMGVAGEIAFEGSPGPGTFAVRFLDALYGLDLAGIEGRLRLSVQ